MRTVDLVAALYLLSATAGPAFAGGVGSFGVPGQINPYSPPSQSFQPRPEHHSDRGGDDHRKRENLPHEAGLPHAGDDDRLPEGSEHSKLGADVPHPKPPRSEVVHFTTPSEHAEHRPGCQAAMTYCER
jgi:hypothetical protein